MKTLLLIFLGGGLGSSLRYGISMLFKKIYTQEIIFPWHTLTINILGCFLLGLLVAYNYKQTNPWLNSFFVIGFCGGFTTFSTFSYEIITLFKSGLTSSALLYLLLSIILGCIAIILGLILVK